jgi:LPS export ABC transporter protein LptC
MRYSSIFFWILLALFNAHLCIALEDSPPSLEIECNDIEIFYSEKGIVKYKLEAKDVTRLKDESIQLPNGGTLICYDNEGKVEFKAHANGAQATADSKIWDFEGDVYIETNNTRLSTDKLHWNRNDEMLSTNDFVEVRNDDSLLVGEGMLAKQDLSYFKIIKPRGSMKVAEEE